jgi:hypothetical protein
LDAGLPDSTVGPALPRRRTTTPGIDTSNDSFGRSLTPRNASPNLGTLRIAEHFTVSGGKITRIGQIHDTAALRAAGFGEGL